MNVGIVKGIEEMQRIGPIFLRSRGPAPSSRSNEIKIVVYVQHREQRSILAYKVLEDDAALLHQQVLDLDIDLSDLCAIIR